MLYIPQFYEKENGFEKHYDLFSRLLKDRIILLFNEITDDLASIIIGQLLYLESIDQDKDITIYINSPGGSVSAGLAIYDTIKNLKCDVSTICLGTAASMGAFILSSGTKGKRCALRNSQILIHQVLGGVSGQASDIEIAAEHILKVKRRINELLAKNTNQNIKQIEKDTDRDNWMFAIDAKEYGIIDKVIGV